MKISIWELEILKKYFLELNLTIQAPGTNFQVPWRPGALYLSTPDVWYQVLLCLESELSGKK
jgi:hypothetical protein